MADPNPSLSPIDGRPASVGNGTHFGFVAPDKAAVHAFYAAAFWDLELVQKLYVDKPPA